MKYLLHIDTATDIGMIAVTGDGAVLGYRTNNESRNHASTINNMIADVLTEVQLSLKNINAVVVSGGPGSYTGLRIGLSTAKGLCYALDVPLIMDSRLTLLAWQAYKNRNMDYDQYITLITAREKEYFISIYDKDFICKLIPQHITEEQLQNIIQKTVTTHITTNATEYVVKSLNIINLEINTDITTDLISWGFYAFEQYKCNNIVNLSSAEPFYLKQVYTHK